MKGDVFRAAQVAGEAPKKNGPVAQGIPSLGDCLPKAKSSGEMAVGAMRMGEGSRYGVERGHVDPALATTQAIRRGAEAPMRGYVDRGEIRAFEIGR